MHLHLVGEYGFTYKVFGAVAEELRVFYYVKLAIFFFLFLVSCFYSSIHSNSYFVVNLKCMPKGKLSRTMKNDVNVE